MRVSSPRHSGSTPVARGSRVPVCPTFLMRRSWRTRRTTSKEVGPAGLSTTRTPCMTSGGGLPPLLGAQLAEHVVDLGALLHRAIEGEVDLGGDAQLDGLGDLAANEALGGVQPGL